MSTKEALKALGVLAIVPIFGCVIGLLLATELGVMS